LWTHGGPFPEMSPKPLVYNAELVRREDFTPELTTFHIRYDEPPPGARAPFVPGQYVALGLNNEERPELGSVRRSMSICSAPEQGGTYEFYIRYVNHPESDNPLTHLLWRRGPGDRIFMTRKPVGVFTLPQTMGESDERWRIFVAAGTGLAPFLSMVRSAHLRDPGADLSRTVLLHGASYPADLCYRDELMGYVRDHGLHYFGSVSRPREAPDWSGDTGRVESYLVPEKLEELERRLGLAPGHLTPRTAGVLICGLVGTIRETVTRLLARGFIPHDRRIRRVLEVPAELPSHVFWEQYDNDPVLDLDSPDVVAGLRAHLRTAWAAAG
jgi:ferredoxin/flavodoxin---NADP+ reductase